MLVRGFPAGSFGTNCFVVATGPGQECVVVDPGQDAVPGLDDLLREHRLQPVAVLLTHGHIDHMWSVVPVCGAHGIPAYVHPDDRALLSDPARGLSMAVGSQLFGGMTFSEPDDVVELSEAGPIELAGVRFEVDLAPGHTPGSIVFRTGDDEPVMLAGDLLFAGSIGRTDLPGGDWGQMQDSLRRVVLPLPDETVVLPGHGAATTIGRERATNPFLQELVPAPPTRGL
ncbi:MAG: MBL fold metallo-hydrolase [Mycobacteriales bacterium]|nr:MBL fold metallo-hydrolase [Mycobacteriales bacterium]